MTANMSEADRLRIIWSNAFDYPTDEECREKIIEGWENKKPKDITQRDIEVERRATQECAWDAAWHDLDKETEGRIIAIADLDLWSGHKSAFKLCGRNLRTVLTTHCGDGQVVWFDGKDVVAKDMHHDGTNKYTFREIIEGAEGLGETLMAIYNGRATAKQIESCTKSLAPYMKSIYFWDEDKPKKGKGKKPRKTVRKRKAKNPQFAA